VKTLDDTLVRVTWLAGGLPRKRTMYFQDAPYFWLDGSPAARQARVLARYRNKGADKKIAMVVVPYGRGKVGVPQEIQLMIISRVVTGLDVRRL
jgi:hypothetical protein